MPISDDLDDQISVGAQLSELTKEDVIRQALRIGLPQFAARFAPAPLWLEDRIREALAEPPEETTIEEISKNIRDIANGR